MFFTKVIEVYSFVRVITTPPTRYSQPGSTVLHSRIPSDVKFEPEQIEIQRYLGKIDMLMDKAMLEELKRDMDRRGVQNNRASMQWNPLSEFGRATSVRVFEARIPDGTKCFLKEYLPLGVSYGKREISLSRRLTNCWNNATASSIENRKESSDNDNDTADDDEENSKNEGDNRSGSMISRVPFPQLLGSLKTDDRIEDKNFRDIWTAKFPRVLPPARDNIWLIFKWDEATFRTIKRFASLPQVVDGLDYFRKDVRIAKRWRFIRRMMRKSLEALNFLHKSGYCHGAMSAESIWMTTSNEKELDQLHIKLTDLGNANKFSDLGSQARAAAYEDIYQLGLIFLELVFASFSNDYYGAQNARMRVTGRNPPSLGTVISRQFEEQFIQEKSQYNSQYDQKELQVMFESYCNSDFQMLRDTCKGIPGWKDACFVLESDNGAAWKLIFRMLARGRLFKSDGRTKLKITCSSLIRDAESLWS